MEQSGSGGRGRPHEEADGEYPLHVEAVHQPSGRNLHTAVGPKKCREQRAQLQIRDAEFVFDQVGRDGEIAAVDVVDEHRQA